MIDSLEFPSENNTNEKEIENLKRNLKKKSKTPNKQSTKSFNNENIMKVKKNDSKKNNNYSKNSAYNSLINKIRSTTPNILQSSQLKFKNKKSFLSNFSRSLNNFYQKNNLNEDEDNSIINKRNKFQLLLGKLNDNSTKEIAYNQIKEMINNNKNQESLRIFISCLSKYDPTSSIKAKEYYALLYGYISKIFQENLMDPLDKPPNIIKTINRILTHIRQYYLNQNSYNIHKASAISICDIYDYCMPKDNIKTVYMIFIEPFINIINNGNVKVSQEGCAVCLSDFIYHLGKENGEFNNKILSTLDEKIIALCVKSSLDNSYIFEALYNLMQFTNIENYNNYLSELYQRIFFILSKNNQNKFNYLTKIFCLNILSLIANKVKNIVDISIGFYQEDILKVIEFNTKDKVIKVQNAAKEALINWIELKKIYQEIDSKKREINLDMKNLDLDKNNYYDKNKEGGHYVKKMDKLNFLRNLAKMAKIENNKVDYNTELPETMKEQVYKKGIGNVLQFSNFLSKVNNKSENNIMRNSAKRNQKIEINDYIKNSKQVKRYNANLNEENKLNINNLNYQDENINIDEKMQNKYNINIHKFNDYDNQLYDEKLIKNEKLLDQISHENQKSKKENSIPERNYYRKLSPIRNNIIDNSENIYEQNNNNLVIENEYKNENIFKNKKPIKNINNINNLNQINNMEDSSNDLDNLKQKLNNMLYNQIIKKVDDFEKNINSRLDEMSNRVNDLYLKLENYDSNKILKDKNGVSYKIINNKLYKEVINDIKKEINNNNLDSQITKNFKEALTQIENNNPNEAYSIILNSEDDIYLIRLIFITGPILNNLSIDIARKVLMRINMVARSHQIQNLLVSLVRNSIKYNVFYSLSENEQNDILDSLYEISGLNDDLGKEAAEIYANITKVN